ncbi:MAG: hypothetical protein ACR2PG_00595 [Hyphomicrobiaceae bacterium]
MKLEIQAMAASFLTQGTRKIAPFFVVRHEAYAGIIDVGFEVRTTLANSIVVASRPSRRLLPRSLISHLLRSGSGQKRT